jgi:uncharacterized protein YlxW (UPF0749 family)
MKSLERNPLMVNLFPHDKQQSKEFERLNTLMLRQANQMKSEKANSEKLKQQVTELQSKVK